MGGYGWIWAPGGAAMMLVEGEEEDGGGGGPGEDGEIARGADEDRGVQMTGRPIKKNNTQCRVLSGGDGGRMRGGRVKAATLRMQRCRCEAAAVPCRDGAGPIRI